MIQTHLLTLQPPYDYIFCNGEVGRHIATYIVGESKVGEDGTYELVTHSHPVVQYLDRPKGVVWNRAELTDCEVLCNDDDMRVDVYKFFLLCIQQSENKRTEAEANGKYEFFEPNDETEPLKAKLRECGIGFKAPRKGVVVEVPVEVGGCSDGYFGQLIDTTIFDLHHIEPTLDKLAKRLTEDREYWEEFYDHVIKVKFTPEGSTATDFFNHYKKSV